MGELRGSYQMGCAASGSLLDHVDNLEKLRRLFCDGSIINNDWGPGNDGDFDHGSWHILCHLAGGAGVFQSPRGRAWCAITHEPRTDRYHATLTYREGAQVRTTPLTEEMASQWLSEASCIGFIEGASQGRTLVRNAQDSPQAFNGWPRQAFDHDVSSEEEGGVVWEHWSTTRDLRVSSDVGSSTLQGWLTLVAHLGGRFVAAVARGRRQHSHPHQLVSLVRAGVLTEAEATWNVAPDAIPAAQQALLYQARPADALAAIEKLPFAGNQAQYFMYPRRIAKWSSAADVHADLEDAVP